MEMKGLMEAKKIVESVAKIESDMRKIEYVSNKLKKLDEIYHYSKEFKPVQRATRRIEITTTEFLENKLSIPSGVYFITNLWIYEDDIYNYLTTFVLRTKPDEEVIIYGEGFYVLTRGVLDYIADRNLFFVFVREKDKWIARDFAYGDPKVANVYQRNGIYIYELHNRVLEFLNSFWWSKCEASAWLDAKERFKI
jgi:hypothetical protein